MTSQRAHALLSDLHKLLATYEANDFRLAGEFSERLEPALQILSTLTGIWVDVPTAVSASEIDEQIPQEAHPADRRSSQRLLQSTQGQIEAMIYRTQFASTAYTLSEFNRVFEIGVRVDSKDGKGRIVQKLAKAISLSSKNKKSHILAELKKLGSSQTSGWINVLKSEK